MLKILKQKEYVIKGTTQQIKSHIGIIGDFLSKNYPIRTKLMSVFRFEIDSYFSMLKTNYTNLLKLRIITGQNIIFYYKFSQYYARITCIR